MSAAAITFAPGQITDDMLTFKGPMVWSLAGGGFSPRIFDGLDIPGVAWAPIDWALAPGPYDPESIAHWLGQALRRRQGPTVLAGHSLGAFNALLTAIRYPQCVQALVLSNTGPRIEEHSDPGLPQRVRQGWDEKKQTDYLRACFHQPPPAQLLAHCQAYLAALSPDTLLQGIEGLRRLDISTDLQRVQCPALIAHGQHDNRRPLASAHLLASGIPAARLHLLPGGHTPMVDCPLDYQRAVHQFLFDIHLATKEPIHEET